jgi:hypothetical protein
MKIKWKTWDVEKIKCNNLEIKEVFGSERVTNRCVKETITGGIKYLGKVY